jgi:hypothetical protein
MQARYQDTARPFVALRASALLAGTLVTSAFVGPAHGASANPFDDSFWATWGDGRAEVSSYDLEFRRYGEVRHGSAVAIYVTETFSEEARVKADPGVHASTDEFPVMKLNLVQDFPTGIYDYNVMTSAFVALTSRWNRPIGSPAKVSFSSQEWCGHVYHQLVPHANGVEDELHSYFDGEADRTTRHEYPVAGQFEDALFLWARGFATPFLDPGETRDVKLLRSLETSRLRHVDVAWEDATLSRGATPSEVIVPAGTFTVETLQARIGDRTTWTFLVEAAPPRRIVQWSDTDGRLARLVAGERLKYREMTASALVSELPRIGLKSRPARTP